MSSVQHKLESVAIAQSTQYKSASTAVKNAARKVEELSRYADAGIADTAKEKLQAIEAEKDSVLIGMSAYANPDRSPKTNAKGQPYKTLAAQWCDRLRAIQIQAAPWQETLDKYQSYVSAVAYHESVLANLAALDARQVAIGGSPIHPMFVDLGRLLRAAPDEMKVVFMFVSSAAAEILGTLSILISSMLGKKRSFTLDEIEQMSGQLAEQRARLQHVLGFDLLSAPNAPAFAMQPQAAPPDTPYQAAAQPLIQAHSAPLQRHAMPQARLQQTATGLQHLQEKQSLNQRHEDFGKPAPRGEHSDDLHTEYRNILEAILQNRCAPQVKALQRHFSLDPRAAEACLEVLCTEGYLEHKAGKYMLCHSIRPGDSLCHGVSYREADDTVRVYFNADQAALPVKMRSGRHSQLPWGGKAEDPGSLPFGGWASLESIHAGRWEAWRPRPVKIAASGYVQKDAEGESHYFELETGANLQGLMAEDREQQVIYLVTIQSPKAYRHISPRWPRLVSEE